MFPSLSFPLSTSIFKVHGEQFPYIHDSQVCYSVVIPLITELSMNFNISDTDKRYYISAILLDLLKLCDQFHFQHTNLNKSAAGAGKWGTVDTQFSY